jgi:hypothetical protein
MVLLVLGVSSTGHRPSLATSKLAVLAKMISLDVSCISTSGLRDTALGYHQLCQSLHVAYKGSPLLQALTGAAASEASSASHTKENCDCA